MNTSSNTKSRIAWVDLAKGITILLVIIGHTVSYNKYGSSLRGLIFSFHMPLFFILSSMTSRSSANREQFVEKIKKSARHLLVPALLTFSLRIVYAISQDHNLLTSKEYWINKLYSLILQAGWTLPMIIGSFRGWESDGSSLHYLLGEPCMTGFI